MSAPGDLRLGPFRWRLWTNGMADVTRRSHKLAPPLRPFKGILSAIETYHQLDGKWPIILANTCSRLKNSISHRRLFVSKSLHGIDLCRVAGGNVAGHGCDRHQERRDHNQSQQIVSLNTVEKPREQWRGGKRARNADHHSDERKHHSLSQH